MITKEQQREARQKAAELMRQAGLVLRPEELEKMDTADFGLSDLWVEGAQIVSLFETEKVAARVIALFPHQTEPEHLHPAGEDAPGKEETLRVISGRLLLYVEGNDTMTHGRIPQKNARYYTCHHELVLLPCDTVTLVPGSRHWFQAGEEPTVFYTMSTAARDLEDVFTNPDVVRATRVRE